MSDEFPASVLRAVRDAAQVNDDGLNRIKEVYSSIYREIDAPDPDALTIGDAVAVSKIATYRPELGSWEDFKKGATATQQNSEDILNPYIPLWFSKTEDRENTWVTDCGSMSAAAKERVKRVFREASPQLNKPIKELLQTAPVSEHDAEQASFLMDIIKSMMRCIPLFLINKGGTNHTGEGAVWRWGPTLCIFSGFGLKMLQYMANSDVLNHDQDWMHWGKCSYQELVEDIQEARLTHGYPCGLARVNFRRMYSVLKNEPIMRKGTETPYGPPWMTILVALHVLKHARLMYDDFGNPCIFVCHDGKRKYIPLDPKDIHAPISSLKAPCGELCSILGIPYNSGRNGRDWIHMCSSTVMNALCPEFLPRMRDVSERSDLVVPTGVSWRRPYIPRGEVSWANPGVEVCRIASINRLNGHVKSDASVGDLAPLMYQWPVSVMEEDRYRSWSRALPDVVKAEPASRVLTRHIRNISNRGLPEGFCAMVDTLMTADFMRRRLVGSAVGGALSSEFPLVFVLPEGATLDDTTNQGKSNMVKVLADAIRPGLGNEIGQIARTVSAPAMRNIAGKIAAYGTFPVDEFVMPRSGDHAFNSSGLQNLATGHSINLGRAGENDVDGVRLRHFFPIAAKLAPDTPDILNRMTPIFLDEITEENAATEDELELISSGKLGTLMRLSHMMWLEESGVVHKIRDSKLGKGKWRFKGHRTIASILYPNGAELVDKYLEASMDHIDGQIRTGAESGLADDIGAKSQFTFKWFLTHADETTLHWLYNECRVPGRRLSVLDVVRELVEDGEKRNFATAIRQAFLTEAKVEVRARRELRKPLIRDKWTITLEKDAKGEYIMVNNPDIVDLPKKEANS